MHQDPSPFSCENVSLLFNMESFNNGSLKGAHLLSNVQSIDFQQPLIQSSVLHDNSEIILICWFGAWETFLIITFENDRTA